MAYSSMSTAYIALRWSITLLSIPFEEILRTSKPGPFKENVIYQFVSYFSHDLANKSIATARYVRGALGAAYARMTNWHDLISTAAHDTQSQLMLSL